MKICPVCKNEKPLEDFHNSPSGKYGKGQKCKPCANKQITEYRRALIASGLCRMGDGKKLYHQGYCEFHHEDRRERDLRRKTQGAWTMEAKRNAWYEQDGKCAGCGKDLVIGKDCQADHDHTTGKRRGILCFSCNHLLGLAKDNVTTLRQLASYLESFQSSPLVQESL